MTNCIFSFYFFTIEVLSKDQAKTRHLLTCLSIEAAKEMEMGGQGLLNVKLKVSNSAEKNPGVHGWLIINKPGFGDVLLVGGHIYFPLGGLCSWIFFNVKVQSFCITALCGCRLQK